MDTHKEITIKLKDTIVGKWKGLSSAEKVWVVMFGLLLLAFIIPELFSTGNNYSSSSKPYNFSNTSREHKWVPLWGNARVGDKVYTGNEEFFGTVIRIDEAYKDVVVDRVGVGAERMGPGEIYRRRLMVKR